MATTEGNEAAAPEVQQPTEMPMPWAAIHSALAVRRRSLREAACRLDLPDEQVTRVALWIAIDRWRSDPADEEALLSVAALAALAWSERNIGRQVPTDKQIAPVGKER